MVQELEKVEAAVESMNSGRWPLLYILMVGKISGWGKVHAWSETIEY